LHFFVRVPEEWLQSGVVVYRHQERGPKTF